ncbi:hypothetical protein TELCIR_13004 [Teladorsagia circumcincta]|uniref:Uncharacterized protein n=1 Tax=Teladorsagia circumcincta TaxID=45464 RepID=A0A2G9U592_TELCI|nr:hypothetical protein TELCIR_13004 [Teladorsagia circumcincta]
MLSGTVQDKTRSGTGKMLADAFLSGFERRRANSGSTRSRSRASSSASALKKLRKAMHRRRLDSGSSAGSRRLKGMAGFNDRGGFDLFDSFQVKQCFYPTVPSVFKNLNPLGSKHTIASYGQGGQAAGATLTSCGFLSRGVQGRGRRARWRMNSAWASESFRFSSIA